MSTAKRLVRDMLARRPLPRLPFIPWIGGYAARIAGVTPREMFESASTLAAAMQGAQALCGYDAIVSPFDLTLLAGACGCPEVWEVDAEPRLAGSLVRDGRLLQEVDPAGIGREGRLGVVVEATERASRVVGREVAIIGMVTGPLTLAGQLWGEGFGEALAEGIGLADDALALAGKVVTQVARAFGERAAVDALVVAEVAPAGCESVSLLKALPAWRTLWNVSRFYNAPPILVADGWSGDWQRLFTLGAAGVTIGRWPDLAAARRRADEQRAVLGAGLPAAALIGATADLDRALGAMVAALGPQAAFLTTEGAVPLGAPVAQLQRVVEQLQQLAGDA